MALFHAQSCAAFLFLLTSYTLFNMFLQYVRGFRILSSRSNAPYRRTLVLVNITVGSSFAGGVTECAMRGWTPMRFGPMEDSIAWSAMLIVAAYIYENIMEYYWHRSMHLPVMYRLFHKIHHFHKRPEPFDDLYVHPIEVAGYYCILYSPAFIFPFHAYSYFTYMVIMGLTGVLDHSGVPVHIPGIYNSDDHATHHVKFNVNYAFPHPFMDILHGTFDGEFLGYAFRTSGRSSQADKAIVQRRAVEQREAEEWAQKVSRVVD